MDHFERDPFAVDPLPRAYYYPSPEKKLPRNQKLQTTLSPSRQPTEEKPHRNAEEESRLSPMDEVFLRSTNIYQPKMTSQYDDINGNADDDEKFDETWPSSERPSSMSLTGTEGESPMNMEKFQATIDRFTDLKKTLSFIEHESPGTSPQLPRRGKQLGPQTDTGKKTDRKTGGQSKSQIPVRGGGKTKLPAKEKDVTVKQQEDTGGGSVLQRYIERFRNSAPLSREERERQKAESSKDFWWLSSSPPSGTTQAYTRTSVQKEEGLDRKTSQVTPLTTVNLDKYSNLQKLRQNGYQKTQEIPASPGDRKTRELQERAEKLLERSSSSVLSTEPAVSTEGLGSNTSGMSSLEEYPYRPKFAHFLDKEDQQNSTANPYTYKSDIPPRRIAPPCPEDDPLHQWRLRRRMEQAQETAPKTVQSFGFLTKTEQQKKIDSQLEEFKRKLAGKETRTKPLAPCYQFTPAPGQEQVCEREQPPIASPVLHRQKPKTSTDTEINPHLHLVCDLLPCPHRGKYDNNAENSLTDTTSSGFTKEKLGQKEIASPREAFINDKDRTQRAVDERFSRKGKLISDSERISDRRHSEDESRYTQFLEAEKPDIESKSDSDRSVKSDRSRQVKETRRKKTDKESVIDYKKDSDLDKEELRERKNDRARTRQRGSSLPENLPRDEEPELPPEKIQSEEDRSRSRETKKEKLRPRLSSSPKRERKVVDDAIGQVVKNHLFSMSTSTVISSVESLPPSASVDGLPRVPEHSADEQSTRQDEAQTENKNEDESYRSDGEFQDDHLLQMLRKQRGEYELQLREIDAVLDRLEQR